MIINYEAIHRTAAGVVRGTPLTGRLLPTAPLATAGYAPTPASAWRQTMNRWSETWANDPSGPPRPKADEYVIVPLEIQHETGTARWRYDQAVPAESVLS